MLLFHLAVGQHREAVGVDRLDVPVIFLARRGLDLDVMTDAQAQYGAAGLDGIRLTLRPVEEHARLDLGHLAVGNVAWRFLGLGSQLKSILCKGDQRPFQPLSVRHS